jgi:hypothetical protein
MPTIAIQALAAYLGLIRSNKYVNTIPSTIPYRSLVLVAIIGTEEMSMGVRMLAAKMLMISGAMRFLSTI